MAVQLVGCVVVAALDRAGRQRRAGEQQAGDDDAEPAEAGCDRAHHLLSSQDLGR